MLHIKAALDMLKKYAKQGGKRGAGGAKEADAADPSDQLRKLQLQVSSLCLAFGAEAGSTAALCPHAKH